MLYEIFGVPLENFSVTWRRHHCRWRAANFDLCSALMAIEQWGFFSVLHLLWHGASVYDGHLRGPVTLAIFPSVKQWSRIGWNMQPIKKDESVETCRVRGRIGRDMPSERTNRSKHAECPHALYEQSCRSFLLLCKLILNITFFIRERLYIRKSNNGSWSTSDFIWVF